MSLLSRVAERLYWAARYLERAETTSRLARVYGNLLLDLPRETGMKWDVLVQITGGTQLYRELYPNPGPDTAERMAFSVRQRYPRGRTGTLRDRVVVEQLHPSSGASLRWKVRSKAPHAHLYERGTVNRRTASTGANRGRMAAHPIFIPEAIRHRTVMVHRLVDLLARQTVPQMTGHMEVRRT